MSLTFSLGSNTQLIGSLMSLYTSDMPLPPEPVQGLISEASWNEVVAFSEAEAAEQPQGATAPAADSTEALARELAALRAEIEAQRTQMKEQARQIAQQQAQLEALQSLGGLILSEQRGAGATPLAQNEAAKTLPSTQASNQAPPDQPVGEAPPAERQLAPRAAALPEGQGVLTPRGNIVMETSLEYTRSSANRLVFRGFELIPGIQIGVIEASDVDRDASIGTIGLRYGLTNRLEIEGRMPVLARRDRIQVAQLRNEGIVREIKLNGFDLGDAEIGVRYQVNRPKGPEDPIYVASLKLKSNTGRGPFDIGYDSFGVATGLATGSGFWALQPGVSFLLPSDPGVIYGGMSYLWHMPRTLNKTVGGALVGRVDPGDALAGNLGFGFALNPRFSFSLGYSHNYIFPSKTEIGGTNQRSKSLQVGSFAVGTSFRISERQSFNMGFEFGMTSDAPDVSISIRLPLRF